MRNLDPFVRLTGARARVVLTHTIETMPSRYMHKMKPFTQTGIENNRALARPKRSLKRNKSLRLVYAGELKDWKGAKLALDSALRFFVTEPQATLTVIGDGPLRNEMENTARVHKEGHRVAFMGRIPMDALVDELNAADVFIYPSFHHGLATIVLQAMLTGLPIVCIEGDAIARTIGSRAGITVQLSEGDDPVEGLAAALLHLARNETDRQQFAAAAREMAVEEYDYNTLARRHEEILQSVVADAYN